MHGHELTCSRRRLHGSAHAPCHWCLPILRDICWHHTRSIDFLRQGGRHEGDEALAVVGLHWEVKDQRLWQGLWHYCAINIGGVFICASPTQTASDLHLVLAKAVSASRTAHVLAFCFLSRHVKLRHLEQGLLLVLLLICIITQCSPVDAAGCGIEGKTLLSGAMRSSDLHPLCCTCLYIWLLAQLSPEDGAGCGVEPKTLLCLAVRSVALCVHIRGGSTAKAVIC
mmetsp:Transcript_48428/g.89208  ORF Transcript_48428/g.89208 Transcript_48428/m.89208 type:complete len:226 (+) Transcript_48428:785-1462(+)